MWNPVKSYMFKTRFTIPYPGGNFMNRQNVAELITKVKALEALRAIREEVAGFVGTMSLEEGVAAIRGFAPRLREIADLFPADEIVGPSIRSLAEDYAITEGIDNDDLVSAEQATMRAVDREEIALLKQLLALHGVDLTLNA